MVLALLAVVVTGAVMLLSSEIRRPASNDDTPLEFVVSSGETTTSIATRLAEQKLALKHKVYGELTNMRSRVMAARDRLRDTLNNSVERRLAARNMLVEALARFGRNEVGGRTGGWVGGWVSHSSPSSSAL
jgi:hypothetical protein